MLVTGLGGGMAQQVKYSLCEHEFNPQSLGKEFQAWWCMLAIPVPRR